MKRLAKMPEGLRDAYDAALAQGWTVTRTGSSHLAWRPPGGGTVYTSGTPGDPGGARKAVSELRQAGLDLPQASRALPRQRGTQPRSTKLRPGRGVLLAEARRVIGVPSVESPDTGLYDQLTALRYTLTLLYSCDRCPDCPHLGWAHHGHCGRSCSCGMRTRLGGAA